MSYLGIEKYKRDSRLNITISNMTRLQLERLAKQYGMSFSSIVEALINETFNHNNLELQNDERKDTQFDQTIG